MGKPVYYNKWRPSFAWEFRLSAALLLATLLCCGSAAADPVRFNWRLFVCDPTEGERKPPQSPAATGPNPVVLPDPEPLPQARTDGGSGWHWLRPQLAANPGSNSSRTAVRLANSEQERELARRHGMMDGILPGALSGLAPLAIESGIEWRF